VDGLSINDVFGILSLIFLSAAWPAAAVVITLWRERIQ
jgi:hypothetical protein